MGVGEDKSMERKGKERKGEREEENGRGDLRNQERMERV